MPQPDEGRIHQMKQLCTLVLVCVATGCGPPRLTPAQIRHKACLGYAAASTRDYLAAIHQSAQDVVGVGILRHCAMSDGDL